MPTIELRPFTVDVTPPIGRYLCGGLHPTSLSQETPIYLHGLIITSGGGGGGTPQFRCVIAAIDYCYLCGRSHQRLEQALAAGAGVPVSHAVVQSNHVHDVPLIDEEAHAVMANWSSPTMPNGIPGVHDETYFAGVLRDVTDAARRAAAGPGIEVGGISFAQGKVEGFASTRRVMDAQNKAHVRFSRCRDPKIREAPEGKIDPMMDQVLFRDRSGKPRVALSFYASHPQVSDGRRAISGDTVGVARDLFTAAHPDIFQIYFTGCAGDITAGKYTTSDFPRDRLWFGVRLYDGMQAALAAHGPAVPITRTAWFDDTFDLTLSLIPEPLEHFAKAMDNPALPVSGKYLAAMKIDRLRRNINRYPFRTSRLAINDIDLFFAPSELVVDYQFFAKSLSRGHAAIAAYGDSFIKYVATDEMFPQGGYEVDPAWSEIAPGTEGQIKDAMKRVMRGG